MEYCKVLNHIQLAQVDGLEVSFNTSNMINYLIPYYQLIF
jgi:hypothetical protein